MLAKDIVGILTEQPCHACLVGLEFLAKGLYPEGCDVPGTLLSLIQLAIKPPKPLPVLQEASLLPQCPQQARLATVGPVHAVL